MKINFLLLVVSFTAIMPALATARQEPSPPPSGVVIHLFGQDSVLSNVIPTAPAGGAKAAGAASGGVAAPPAYREPTTGQVLHEMFVTGDPNDPPRPSTGRTKQRLAD